MRLVESYAHKAAKDVLTQWLRDISRRACDGVDVLNKNPDVGLDPLYWRINRGAPHYGIWQEYPVMQDGRGSSEVWDEMDAKWQSRPPTYNELLARGEAPAVILDIAVQHKGTILAGFEICHKNPISWEKRFFLERMGVFVYEIPAKWILNQIRMPDKLPI